MKKYEFYKDQKTGRVCYRELEVKAKKDKPEKSQSKSKRSKK